MRFLVIGDFHGKFLKGIKGVLKKEKIDMILSSGDYCGNEEWGKIFFKYYYDNDGEEIPEKVEKRFKALYKKATVDGLKVVRELKKLKMRFFGIRGNWDPLPWSYDIGGEKRDDEKKNSKKLIRLQTKDFNFIDLKLIDMGNFILIGGISSTNPGKVDKKTLRKVEEEEGEREVKKRIKESNRRKKNYEKLFLRAKKLKKTVIFLTHNVPYNTKLDKVKKGLVKGKHYGSFLEREIIRRFKPELVLCGHMHENQGRDKLGKSIIVNVGSVLEKQYTIVDWNENKGKVKRIRFVR